MKWIILAFTLIAFVSLSFAANHVPAEYGSCQEEEYNGEIINVWLIATKAPLHSLLTFDICDDSVI